MKKISLFKSTFLCLILFFLLASRNTKASHIYFSGSIDVNTTWSGVDTVRVNGDVYIGGLVTLAISPGVCVYFQGPYRFMVYGTLRALGTPADSVVFTGNPNNSWRQIIFDYTNEQNDSTIMRYCRIENSHSHGSSNYLDGGAMYVYNFSKVRVENCTFKNNLSLRQGGAIYCESSDILIRSCSIHNNESNELGGGMFLLNCTPYITNCIFNNNVSTGGGGICFRNSDPIVTNMTIVNHESAPLYCIYDSDPVFRNCIIYNSGGGEIYLQDGECDPDFYYCNINQNGIYGDGSGSNFNGAYVGNIYANPQFTGSSVHPFDLSASSLCINAGDPATTQAQAGKYDIAGGSRFISGWIDIGAYEYFSPPDDFPGNCLYFDGTNDYVNVGNFNNFPLGNTLTIECWIKPEDLAGRQGVFSTRFNNAAGSFQLEVGIGYNGTNRLGVSGVNTWVAQTGDNVIIPGEWIHIAYTRSDTGAGTHTIYVNGQAQTLISDANYTFIDNSSNKVIGSGTNNNQFFRGEIEEMRVWNVARTEQQIRESMHHNISGRNAGQISYWQFNAQNGTAVSDAFETNTGSLVNMDNSAWIVSAIPFGPGAVCTKTETTGLVDFTGTGVSVQYSAHNNATVTMTRIDTSPNQVPGAISIVLSDQYWVLNRYGSGSFIGNIAFTVDDGVWESDESNPSAFKLYNRSSTSESGWVLLDSAIMVNAAEKKVTFGNVFETGQFLIGKNLSVNGFPGKAIDFDGYEDYINCGNSGSLNLTSGITVEAWIKADYWQNNYWEGTIVGKDDAYPAGYVLRCGENGKLSFVLGINGTWVEAVTSQLMQTGKWYHVAGTYDGEALKVYIDGALSAVHLASGNIGTSSKPVQIGDSPGYPGRFFNGKIDEVRIWNTSISANQIRETMHIPTAVGSPGLIAYWQLNEGVNNKIFDVINGNTGTFFNMDVNSVWLNSTIPFGKGFSNSQTETNGNVEFTGTGVSMYYNIQGGVAVTATRIDTLPNQLPTNPILDSVYQEQYWVINRFGTGNFNADVTFTVGEDLTQTDLNNASKFHLYRREANSDDEWSLFAGSPAIDPVNDQITFSDITGFSQFILAREPYSSAIDVSLYVFLQGPFSGTEMTTTLNTSGLIPLSQPFNTAPWNYAGTESVTVLPNSDVVDWVLIELRDATDAASATAATLVARQAAFLLNNGTVTGLAGDSPLSFSYTPVNSLFAVILHRNSIDVMSAGPLESLGDYAHYSYVFTNSGDKAYGGANAQKELAAGIWGMYAGDGNADGQINNGDKNDVWLPQWGTSGYKSGDFNLDGQVNANDKNDVWEPNAGNGGQVPD